MHSRWKRRANFECSFAKPSCPFQKSHPIRGECNHRSAPVDQRFRSFQTQTCLNSELCVVPSLEAALMVPWLVVLTSPKLTKGEAVKVIERVRSIRVPKSKQILFRQIGPSGEYQFVRT